MSWLLDVNFILASRWVTHPDHVAVKAWIDSIDKFYTCAITELGFVRISLSAGYKATWSEVQQALQKLHERSGYEFLVDDIDGVSSPETVSADTTVRKLLAYRLTGSPSHRRTE